MPRKCPKCSGLLCSEEPHVYRCVNCGHRAYPHVAAPLPANKPPAALRQPTPSPLRKGLKIAQTVDASLFQATIALDSLGKPFTITFPPGESKLFPHGVKVPVFSYRVRPSQKSHPEDFKTRWGKIADILSHYPEAIRLNVGPLLVACHSGTKQSVHLYDLYINEYLRLIAREELRARKLKEAITQKSLFCVPKSLSIYCEDIEEQLATAKRIVEGARQSLAPARKFFLNKRSPSLLLIKKSLFEAFKSVDQVSATKAGKLVSELLSLADPDLSPSPNAIRVGHAQGRSRQNS